MQDVAQSSNTLFQELSVEQDVGTALLVDEVSFRKKGKYSACVDRQYLGSLGKVDNGQVAVCLALSKGTIFSPINIKLFMPESWQENYEKRHRCHIPEKEKHISKPKMALNMIQEAKNRGIKFDYVNFDSLYGSSYESLLALENESISFIGDVKSNHTICISNDLTKEIRLTDYLQTLNDKDFQKITIRQGTKERVAAYFHQKSVKIKVKDKAVLVLELLIRKDKDGTIKYSFTNMDDDTETLAIRQGQRIFVEQNFKESKSQVGMGDYQTRSWRGFHAHMTMCCLAMLFIAKVKAENIEMELTAPQIQKAVASAIYAMSYDPKYALDIIIEQYLRYKKQKEYDRNRKQKT